MPEYALYVTRRALTDDLKLSDSFEGWEAEDITTDLVNTFFRQQPPELSNEEATARAVARARREYGPLFKFVELRRHRPVGQEPTLNLPLHPGATWNIHAGEDRGVTWFDEAGHIVWLCAAGFHRSKDRDDFYQVAVGLDAEDSLLPTVEEIAGARALSRPDPLSDLDAALPGMLQQAQAQPGSEISRRFPRLLGANVFVEVYTESSGGLEEISIGIVVDNPNDAPPDTDLFAYCVSALLPSARPDDLEFVESFPHRGRRRGERIVRICRYI